MKKILLLLLLVACNSYNNDMNSLLAKKNTIDKNIPIYEDSVLYYTKILRLMYNDKAPTQNSRNYTDSIERIYKNFCDKKAESEIALKQITYSIDSLSRLK